MTNQLELYNKIQTKNGQSLDREYTIEWLFTPLTDATTFVSVTEAGFSGDGDEVVKQVLDSTGGFTLVLTGLKALLEHNIRLNLIADRFPEGLENG